MFLKAQISVYCILTRNIDIFTGYNKHSSLMSIKKQWYVKEYANDIHHYLREKEQLRFLYHGNSRHLSTRKSVVVWMVEVADKLKFCNTVKHLAVYLFDMFMDNHEVGNYVKLLALGCLIVAGKYF